MKRQKILNYLLVPIITMMTTHLCHGKETVTKDTINISFLGNSFNFLTDKKKIRAKVHSIKFQEKVNCDSLLTDFTSLKIDIEKVKNQYKLPDWFVYQLIRRIAEQINSKYIDYEYYTLTKYLLLAISGYEPVIFTSSNKILLYVKSIDIIFNLPNKIISGKQYVCLNYHDYGYQINFDNEKFHQKKFGLFSLGRDFQYTINYLPSFQKETYIIKNITFTYKNKKESYTVLVNPEMQDYFTNYPVTEYRYQFNIPFSEIAYNKLIPELKLRIKNFSIEEGVQYIMFFVRDGFEFETDTRLFGREKRLSAEETLVYNSSDCEDRSALFFALVKEIYNLPMAILSYPEHVNVAVQLPKNKGFTININNRKFTVCEPTPQKIRKGIGWIPREIQKQTFEIAYIYQ